MRCNQIIKNEITINEVRNKFIESGFNDDLVNQLINDEYFKMSDAHASFTKGIVNNVTIYQSISNRPIDWLFSGTFDRNISCYRVYSDCISKSGVKIYLENGDSDSADGYGNGIAIVAKNEKTVIYNEFSKDPLLIENAEDYEKHHEVRAFVSVLDSCAIIHKLYVNDGSQDNGEVLERIREAFNFKYCEQRELLTTRNLPHAYRHAYCDLLHNTSKPFILFNNSLDDVICECVDFVNTFADELNEALEEQGLFANVLDYVNSTYTFCYSDFYEMIERGEFDIDGFIRDEKKEILEYLGAGDEIDIDKETAISYIIDNLCYFDDFIDYFDDSCIEYCGVDFENLCPELACRSFSKLEEMSESTFKKSDAVLEVLAWVHF